jgi:hypothetical protein
MISYYQALLPRLITSKNQLHFPAGSDALQSYWRDQSVSVGKPALVPESNLIRHTIIRQYQPRSFDL